jgi:hypothetical protein
MNLINLQIEMQHFLSDILFFRLRSDPLISRPRDKKKPNPMGSRDRNAELLEIHITFTIMDYSKLPDLYSVLKLSRNATLEEIRASYKQLALQCHPDKQSLGAQDKQFYIVSQAYEILSVPESRESYNQWLSCM